MAFSLALIIILGLGADYLFKRLQLPGLTYRHAHCRGSCGSVCVKFHVS